MHPIQLVLVLFAFFALSRVVLRFRRGGISFVNLAAWLLFWCGVGLVAALPETTTVVARWLGVGRGADFAMYLALLAVFFMLFRMFGKIEDLERQITRVVRAAALKELDESITAGPPGPAAKGPEAQREIDKP